MQPLATVAVTRPWHWGIVILVDPTAGGQLPEVDPRAPVSANGAGLVVLVRHAQDIEPVDDDVKWAQAAATVRRWSAPPPVDEATTAVFEGGLATASGRLSIGDADEEVTLTGLSPVSVLRVSLPSDDLESPDRIWVDVWGG